MGLRAPIGAAIVPRCTPRPRFGLVVFVLVFALILAACRDDPQTAPRPAAAPVHIKVTRVSPPSAGTGVLDIEIRNDSDKELACYHLEVFYQGLDGAPLPVRINGRDRRATTTSISLGDSICKPHMTCTAQLKYLAIPPGAVTATVRPLSVKATNARRTGCEDTPLLHVPMTP
jgi:hypothetical protein